MTMVYDETEIAGADLPDIPLTDLPAVHGENKPLTPEAALAGLKTKMGGKHIYYRAPRTGEIGTDAANREVRLQRYEQGYEALPAYGVIDINERAANDLFRQILEQGGAGEFPVEQVIELGWAHKPPVVHGRKVVFPQLAGVDIGEARHCCRRMFPTQEGYDKHRLVMHQKQAETKDLGNAIASGLKQAGLTGGGGTSPVQIAEIIAATLSALGITAEPAAKKSRATKETTT